MPGWHHRLNGRESESRSVVSDTLRPHGLYSHEFGQIPGDGKGQGSLKCCNPWSRRESDTTQQLNSNLVDILALYFMNTEQGMIREHSAKTEAKFKSKNLCGRRFLSGVARFCK